MDAAPETEAIVEVNEPIAELVKDPLNGDPDYQAVAAGDGAHAQEVIRSLKAGLIVMDLNLPGLSGLELYDLLQRDPATAAVPAPFFTAKSQERAFQERGFANVISKPFNLDELLARVAAICRRSDHAPTAH